MALKKLPARLAVSRGLGLAYAEAIQLAGVGLRRSCFTLFLVLNFCTVPAYGDGKWFITPSLTVRETFSDNINLSPSGQESSAFVTEVNPGIMIQNQGGLTEVNLIYQMQNVINRGGSGNFDINHQLQAGVRRVVSPNRFFFNASSSISQQNVVNTGPVTTGNLTNSANRADVYTFAVSPTWTPHFNGYADGIVQLGYDFLSTSSTEVAETNTFRGLVGLTSGYRFKQVTWRLNYNDTYSSRGGDAGNVGFRNYQGEVRYHFNREYAVLVFGGYTDNKLPGVDTRNGEFYTMGLAWSPSRRFRLEGGYGQNLYFVTLNWLPTTRTQVNIGFRHADVGTNLGDIWNAQLSHRSGRVLWSANYAESTTTVQDILASQSIFNTAAGASGQGLLNPGSQTGSASPVTQPFQSNLGLPSFTNSVLIQKQGQVSIVGETAKSSLGLTFFNSRREDQTSFVNDNSTGLSGFWTWRFVPRMSSNLLLSWNRNTTNGSDALNQSANFYVVSLALTRNIADYFNISKGMFGSLTYRYANQDSSNSLFSYTENSVAATLTVNF